ncbi:hypothetical protein [Trichocoleus sp. DQ-A2]|uniref:hypothetical protein n=1 Tax=Trichocoleus sp. DQ-A2 TaxID=2933924 RepID=UPI0032975E9C
MDNRGVAQVIPIHLIDGTRMIPCLPLVLQGFRDRLRKSETVLRGIPQAAFFGAWNRLARSFPTRLIF